jgi:hypothetical protein
MKMDWEAEFREIKSVVAWIVFGMFVTMNSELVANQLATNDTLMELLMVNLQFIGNTVIVIGVVNFLLNTAKLYFLAEEKKTSEE